MDLVSWNVNGIRACLQKGLLDFIRKDHADIYCFQEIKISPPDLKPLLSLFPSEYIPHWQTAEKKGYSGLLCLSRQAPLSVIQGLGVPEFDREARVLGLEFESFFLLNTYFPNAQRELLRLDFKLNFNHHFEALCLELEQRKPVIICGDLNVAHREIDLKNPQQNQNNACFTPQERAWIDRFLKQGHIDTFREFVTEGEHYTWWSYRNQARVRNIGWRLDYFIVSEILRNQLADSFILQDVMGSDHCPVKLAMML